MNVYPVIDPEATGRQLEALRRKNGFSIRALQEELGCISVQALYKWEHGKALPSIDNLLALSFLYHVHIEDLLACSGEEIHFSSAFPDVQAA